MSRVADALRRAEALEHAAASLASHPAPSPAAWPPSGGTHETPWFPEENDAGREFTAQARPAGPSDLEISALRGFSDEMRQQVAGLVERIFTPASARAPRSVAFVAVGPDLGSADIAAAVAEVLAGQTSGTVCMVDANFAAPAVHHRFGVNNETGLANAIASGRPFGDSIQQLTGNLWLLPAGHAEARPAAAGDAAREQLARLSQRFDYVVVDAEGIDSPGQPGGMALLVDGVVLLVAAEQTRRDLAGLVIESLRAAGVSVLGAVVTHPRTGPTPGWAGRY